VKHPFMYSVILGLTLFAILPAPASALELYLGAEFHESQRNFDKKIPSEPMFSGAIGLYVSEINELVFSYKHTGYDIEDPYGYFPKTHYTYNEYGLSGIVNFTQWYRPIIPYLKLDLCYIDLDSANDGPYDGYGMNLGVKCRVYSYIRVFIQGGFVDVPHRLNGGSTSVSFGLNASI